MGASLGLKGWVSSVDCVTESRVRFVVSYFWGIFHPEWVNILPEPQLLSILTSHETVFKLPPLLRKKIEETQEELFEEEEDF